MKKHYDKSHKTWQQQIELLKSKNLVILDENYALEKLRNLNYYRLSAYFLPFYNENKKFVKNTNFTNIIDLYNFDIELKYLVYNALQTIELYFRTQIAYYHSLKFGATGYLDELNFTQNPKKPKTHKSLINTMFKEINRSNESFIKHFKDNYYEIPLWAVVEVMSFRTLSNFYSLLKTNEQKQICDIFSIDKSVLVNWLHVATLVRNICAHHSRLWNKTLAVILKIPNKNIFFKDIKLNNQKIFSFLSVMVYLLNKIDSKNNFKNELKILLKKYPKVDLFSMGFYEGWQYTSLWK